MSSCRSIDPLVTPYVDGELPAGDRALLEDHLRACPPCQARVGREQSVRDLVSARKAALTAALLAPRSPALLLAVLFGGALLALVGSFHLLRSGLERHRPGRPQLGA